MRTAEFSSANYQNKKHPLTDRAEWAASHSAQMFPLSTCQEEKVPLLLRRPCLFPSETFDKKTGNQTLERPQDLLGWRRPLMLLRPTIKLALNPPLNYVP